METTRGYVEESALPQKKSGGSEHEEHVFETEKELGIVPDELGAKEEAEIAAASGQSNMISDHVVPVAFTKPTVLVEDVDKEAVAVGTSSQNPNMVRDEQGDKEQVAKAISPNHELAVAPNDLQDTIGSANVVVESVIIPPKVDLQKKKFSYFGLKKKHDRRKKPYNVAKEKKSRKPITSDEPCSSPQTGQSLSERRAAELFQYRFQIPYWFEKKEFFGNMVSELISDRFPDANRTSVDHMIHCLVLTDKDATCSHKLCCTEKIIPYMNDHLDRKGKPEEHFWSLMIMLHFNQCERNEKCRVKLCRSYPATLIYEMIPDWIFQVNNMYRGHQKPFLNMQFIYKLGSGTFGDVYHVMSRTKNGLLTYVIKKPKNVSVNELSEIIQQPYLIDPQLHSLNSDYIVTPYLWYSLLPMPFLDISLEEYVTRLGGLSSTGCLRILKDVISGVFDLHKIGWVHRDIKCANIVLCWHQGSFQAAKLCDLDSLHRAYMKGYGAGTATNAAPEVKKGQINEVLTKSDMYSCGRILYPMQTGKSLVQNRKIRTNEEILAEFKREYNDGGSSFELLRLIFYGCTQVDPRMRCSANEVLKALDASKHLWNDFVPIAVEALSCVPLSCVPSSVPSQPYAQPSSSAFSCYQPPLTLKGPVLPSTSLLAEVLPSVSSVCVPPIAPSLQELIRAKCFLRQTLCDVFKWYKEPNTEVKLQNLRGIFGETTFVA